MRINDNRSPIGVTGSTLLANFKSKGIHSVFEDIAHRYPDTKAVVHNEQSISYDLLNQRSNYVAQCLLEQGIRKGDLVAVKLDKSIDLVVSLLAILKIGAIYVPIDPSYPAARTVYMLKDSTIEYILTSATYVGQHAEIEELDIAEMEGQLAYNISVSLDPKDVAYIIYTSGTTGNPKGVMVEHRGFVNMCLHQILTYQLSVGERVLQFASISFDASVYEIFIALLSGSTLVIVDKEVILDKNLFLKYIDKQCLTFILLPPVFLNSLGRPPFITVKTIVTAGEACNIEDAIHYSKTKKYFNAYGPTEASVCVSLHQVKPNRQYENYVPIGKAIPAITFYILDEELNPVKDGEEGELYIGGIGLAKGYINKPELTQKAFIDTPNKLGERIYRTGDIVRKTDNGELITLGRKDNQVKIVGHRIELGAIEHTLLQTDSILNAFVCALEYEGDKYLCAYFTSSEEVVAENLREKLLEELPSYMVPHWFIQVPEFKMTTNGKIDKLALPSPFDQEDQLEKESTEADTVEEKLLSICNEILGMKHLSLSDNFFVKGGHSLKAAKLSSRINKEFNAQISVTDIYKKPHLHELVEHIKTAQKSSYQTILPASVKTYYATSAAQKRMFVMNSTDKVDVSYNVSIVLQFESDIAIETVTEALKSLTARHEVLRTRFSIQYEELVQEVMPEVKIYLEQGGKVDVGNLSTLAKEFVRPFDLDVAPILNVGYYEIVQGGTAVIFDTHHIIADGTSMGILMKEFVQLLNQETLPPLMLQYKDFAEWENVQYAKKNYFNAHETYWLNSFQEVPKLKMPVDKTHVDTHDSAGARMSFTIEKELALKLKKYTLDHDVSLYQLLLSVYYLLLSKYSHQKDLVVGTAVANRRKEEVQQMMGMFVNTLALRTQVDPKTTFQQFVKDVKKLVLEAFEYQEYPFELLVSKLGLSGNATKVPLIDTLFIVQNIDFFSDQIKGLSLKYENATATSKFDFSFFIVEQKDSLILDVEYNTTMFSIQYITKLAENFIELANKAVSDALKPLEDITFLDTDKLTDLRAHLFTDRSMDDVDFDL